MSCLVDFVLEILEDDHTQAPAEPLHLTSTRSASGSNGQRVSGIVKGGALKKDRHKLRNIVFFL